MTGEEVEREMRKWECPDCGEHATTASLDLAATVVEGLNPAATQALAHGIDVGPPQTRERPVAYDLTFGCPNGHDTYIRTENVYREEVVATDQPE